MKVLEQTDNKTLQIINLKKYLIGGCFNGLSFRENNIVMYADQHFGITNTKEFPEQICSM